MNHPARKVFALDDGEGRETNTPSTFVSIGDLVQKITRTVSQTRQRNDNEPGWDAADNALPESQPKSR